MKHIHFILNPIAGNGYNQINLKFLYNYFDKENYAITLKQTTHKKHAIELTKKSVVQRADIIVACGGDGTINEVASCLIGTKVILGIVPIGSGNGLASNLKIPKKIDKALLLIKKQSIKQIDVGCLNNNYFFSNSGIGFNASVVKNYELSQNRKLSGYIKASIKSLKEINYNSKVEITTNGEKIITNPLMVFISNSNELGYKFSLTPKASLQDGLLDVLIVFKLNRLKLLLFSILMFFKKHDFLKEVKSFQSDSIKIAQTKTQTFSTQIDGETLNINNQNINISILKKSLQVIAN